MEQVVADHLQAVYRYAYRLAGSAVDAEDLTQQAFLVAQSKRSQVRDASCIRSWLLTVARNHYLKTLRRQLPAPTVDLAVDSLPEAAAESPVDAERLHAALAELPNEFRLVVLMFYFEHLSYQQIAAELGIPIGTVMSRLSRAKAQLRRRLFAGEVPAEPAAQLALLGPHRPPSAAAAYQSPGPGRGRPKLK
jgi:RNA polymerase sigma-70 factor (ECF subfamily)